MHTWIVSGTFGAKIEGSRNFRRKIVEFWTAFSSRRQIMQWFKVLAKSPEILGSLKMCFRDSPETGTPKSVLRDRTSNLIYNRF